MAKYSEYLIQSETLEATADTIRKYINKNSEYSFIPEVDAGDGNLNTQEITIYYGEWIDPNGDTKSDYFIAGGDKDPLIAYGFLKNNVGKVVPVIYNEYSFADEGGVPGPDISQPFFYEGVAEIDEVAYDKWRRIEGVSADGSFDEDTDFGWNTQAEYYLYTNRIVIANGIDPEEFPTKIEEVYQTGYSEGWEIGHDDGYSEGHSAGIAVTNDATATAANIHSGKTAYVKGQKITGTAKTYEEGYQTGSESGYNRGYDDGESDGYSDGYSVGYSSGEKSGISVINFSTFQSTIAASTNPTGYCTSEEFKAAGLNIDRLVEVTGKSLSSDPCYISVNNYHPTLTLYVILAAMEGDLRYRDASFTVPAKGNYTYNLSNELINAFSSGCKERLYWRFA